MLDAFNIVNETDSEVTYEFQVAYMWGAIFGFGSGALAIFLAGFQSLQFSGALTILVVLCTHIFESYAHKTIKAAKNAGDRVIAFGSLFFPSNPLTIRIAKKPRQA